MSPQFLGRFNLGAEAGAVSAACGGRFRRREGGSYGRTRLLVALGVTRLAGGSVVASSDAGGFATGGGLVGRRPCGGCKQGNPPLALLCVLISWNREGHIPSSLSTRNRQNRSLPPYLSATSRPNLQSLPISASIER